MGFFQARVLEWGAIAFSEPGTVLFNRIDSNKLRQSDQQPVTLFL